MRAQDDRAEGALTTAPIRKVVLMDRKPTFHQGPDSPSRKDSAKLFHKMSQMPESGSMDAAETHRMSQTLDAGRMARVLSRGLCFQAQSQATVVPV